MIQSQLNIDESDLKILFDPFEFLRPAHMISGFVLMPGELEIVWQMWSTGQLDRSEQQQLFRSTLQ